MEKIESKYIIQYFLKEILYRCICKSFIFLRQTDILWRYWKIIGKRFKFLYIFLNFQVVIKSKNPVPYFTLLNSWLKFSLLSSQVPKYLQCHTNKNPYLASPIAEALPILYYKTMVFDFFLNSYKFILMGNYCKDLITQAVSSLLEVMTIMSSAKRQTLLLSFDKKYKELWRQRTPLYYSSIDFHTLMTSYMLRG